jgi:DNA-binding FadR family transcriptional regulator
MAASQGSGGGTSKQEAIRSAVVSYITDHGLVAGDPLPPEAALMTALGVGRNALREAMKSLQAIGIVDIRHGFGTYVGSSSLRSLEAGLAYRATVSARGDLREVLNLLEVRRLVELGLTDRVFAEVRDLEPLERIVVEMEQRAAAGEYFADLDWRFHEALYEPLGNALVVELLGVFWAVFTRVESELPGHRYTPAAAAGWHRDIYEALRAGDRDHYLAAFGRHFADIGDRVAGALGGSASAEADATDRSA